MKPCAKCPWVDPDFEIPDAVREAIAHGAWIPCHVHMGTCHGAVAFAKTKTAKAVVRPFDSTEQDG
jgi:hypothetical protein